MDMPEMWRPKLGAPIELHLVRRIQAMTDQPPSPSPSAAAQDHVERYLGLDPDTELGMIYVYAGMCDAFAAQRAQPAASDLYEDIEKEIESIIERDLHPAKVAKLCRLYVAALARAAFAAALPPDPARSACTGDHTCPVGVRAQAAERAKPAASDCETAKAVVQEWMQKTSAEGWLVEELEDLDSIVAAALAERGRVERAWWQALIEKHMNGKFLEVSAFMRAAAIRNQTLNAD